MRYLIISLFFFCSSCNNNTKTVSAETKDTVSRNSSTEDRAGTTAPEAATIDAVNCYMQIVKRDTIVLHIKKLGDAISGKLSFDNYEKDGSTGSVKGREDGDVLKLIYSFASEGMNSVMEVYFKKRGNDLLRGVGEMQTKGDTAYFLYPDKISYPGNGIMKKTDCTEVPAKYK
jgi:hypothetical protein